MDLNKKIAFKCTFEELEDGEEPKDTVNCDKFWENVELNAVANAFPDRKINSLEINPCLNCWSSYLGKSTRHGNNLLNTEFKKVNKSTGKLEADCRFVTEGRTLQMLSSEKLKKVKSVAKSCNIATKGSKLDILLKIKKWCQIQKSFLKTVGPLGRLVVIFLPTWHRLLLKVSIESGKLP